MTDRQALEWVFSICDCTMIVKEKSITVSKRRYYFDDEETLCRVLDYNDRYTATPAKVDSWAPGRR